MTTTKSHQHCEVLIIGAGPAGTVASALLRQQGKKVIILEREQFPRFSIGESLLPQSLIYLEQAGMLQAVIEAGFQYKNGASFSYQTKQTAFDFRDKFSPGWGIAYQVQRANFDWILAKEAEKQGVEMRYQHTVTQVNLEQDKPLVTVNSFSGETYTVESEFILDASGFGRVLPSLLQLDTPSQFPLRSALFTHIEDNIFSKHFDRNKIFITIHPKHKDVWYWLIPFSDGRSSIGIVARENFLAQYSGTSADNLQTLIQEDSHLQNLLSDASWDMPTREMTGYAANVKSLWGKSFALLGNASEFLDPIFSSGVTIAFKSASLASAVLQRQFSGEDVDWENDYAIPLKKGINTFRSFVESWYAGEFQKIIFHQNSPADIRRMICSILAGYAWDEKNPFVKESQRLLKVLEELCN